MIRIPNRTTLTNPSQVRLELNGQPLTSITVPVPPGQMKQVNVKFTFVQGATPWLGLDAIVRLTQADNSQNWAQVQVPATVLPAVLDVVHRIGTNLRGGVSFEVR